MRTSTAQAARSAISVRSINEVVFGDIAFKTWYPSFYPEALVGKDIDTLLVCDQCFAYSNDRTAYLIHKVSRMTLVILIRLTSLAEAVQVYRAARRLDLREG